MKKKSKNKVVTGKKPVLCHWLFCTPHFIFLFVLTLAFDRAVSYGNDTI